MDELDARLAAAGVTRADDAGIRLALTDVVASRRRRRWLAPGIVAMSGLLVLGGVGAATATGLFTWRLSTADYSIARDWYDVEGNYLGSCETRVDIELVDEQVRPIVERWFATHDVDDIEPDGATLARWLMLAGREDRLPELLAGKTFEQYRDQIGVGSAIASDDFRGYMSDAYVLHTALERAVSAQIMREVIDAAPAEQVERGIGASGEIHCTTDPVEPE